MDADRVPLTVASWRASVPQITLDRALVQDRAGGLDFSRVLFLDIDGVLHPEMPTDQPPFACLEPFRACLRRVDPLAALPIVISSDWKLHHGLEELRTRLQDDIARQVVGVTPDWFGRPDGTRQKEITAWMAMHASPGAQWLAIDDRAAWFEAGCSALFLVAPIRQGGPGCLDAVTCAQLALRLQQFLQPDLAGR
ncbi:MAG: HAD domain-containing protein [Rhodoferax sp.]